MSETRVAMVSDTHGMLDAALAERLRGADLAVHAGDIGGAMVLEELRDLCGEVYGVRGNNDSAVRWAVADHAELAALPETLELELPGGVLAVEHGHRAGAVRDRHARLRTRHPDARAIVYGHSHRRVVDDDTLPWVLNPGAAGRVRTYGGPSALLLRIRARRWAVETIMGR